MSQAEQLVRALRTRWTDAELEVLRAMYPTHQTREVASALGRAVSMVQKMAVYLGIKKGAEAATAARRAAGKKANAGQFQRKHGLAIASTRGPIDKTYSSWKSMWQRCTYPRHKSFKDYGARGITVCERWKDFDAFRADMGERPAGLSIDRHPNPNGNYEPGNCRWATAVEQARNRRNSRLIEAMGRRLTVVEWAEVTGIHADTIAWRLRSGLPADAALSIPPNSGRKFTRAAQA